MTRQKKLIIVFIILFAVNFFGYLYTSSKTADLGGMATVDLSACKKEVLSDGKISLTIPAEYVYGAGQEDLDKAAAAAGYDSITLNEDGTATYLLTSEKHQEMMADLVKGINEGLAKIPGADGYKDITSVTANDDFTSYEVHTSNKSADFDSSMAVMILKMYSTMYYAFDGVTDQMIHFDFYNVNNELIATLDTNIGTTAQ